MKWSECGLWHFCVTNGCWVDTDGCGCVRRVCEAWASVECVWGRDGDGVNEMDGWMDGVCGGEEWRLETGEG
jgi:hypothetical protein